MERTRLFFTFALCILFFSLAAHPADSRERDELVLGLPSYLSATELYRHFGPLAEHLGKELGRPVTIHIEVDYEEHLRRLKNGEIDLAFLGPASYVLYTKRFGAIPLLAAYETNGSRTFKGYIVVRADSPVETLAQLKGRTIAFGDAKSTMGHLVPRYLLLRAGVDVKELAGHKFLDNQENVALGVLAGNFAAGAVREDIYNRYAREGLRAVAASEPMSDHLFVARTGLQADIVRKTATVLQGLRYTEEGRKVLAALQKNLTALVPVQDADYDSLRKTLYHLTRAGVKW